MSQGNQSRTGHDTLVAINGHALKTIRTLLRIKRTDLAASAGISVDYLIKLENSHQTRRVTTGVFVGLYTSLPGVPHQAILANPNADVRIAA